MTSLWKTIFLIVLGPTVFGGCEWGASREEQGTTVRKEAFNEGLEGHGGMNMVLQEDEVEALKHKATSSNDAANLLANHYLGLGQTREMVRWLTVAANRGDCAAMSHLREHAVRTHNRREADRWNDMMRRHVCTWGKTYPGISSPGGDALPLWNET